uniref:Amino acid transporter transmembrane domain-containing protein n=1 Tax=Daucus carota subsp. sativus TaxID=79200 RepID=A0A166HYL0_DAUCS
MGDTVEIKMEELVRASSSGSQVLPRSGSLRSDVDPWLPTTENETTDHWLPITESREGGAFSAAFLLICSGMGLQSFVLPVALVSLGWYWGIISLTIGYVWQLYTIWLLVNLHESVPPGIRYSRFMHLNEVGKITFIFPGNVLSRRNMCTLDYQRRKLLEKFVPRNVRTGTLRYQTIIRCRMISPNLNSAAKVAAIGALAAIIYTTLLVVLSLVQDRPEASSLYSVKHAPERQKDIYGAINALGLIAFAFRGHNVVLDIQGTISTSKNRPSKVPMKKGVAISYLVIAACFYPLAIAGYWSYGNKLNMSDNMPLLRSFMDYHRDNMPKSVRAIIYLLVVIHFLSAFQIYGMVVWDNLERIYVTKNNRRCPKWLRGAIRVLFGGFVYFVAVALPFLGVFSALLGGITTVPITFVYPCVMWIIIRNPRRTSPMWYLNVGIALLGIVFIVLVEIAAIRTLVVYGLKASFFHPK